MHWSPDIVQDTHSAGMKGTEVASNSYRCVDGTVAGIQKVSE